MYVMMQYNVALHSLVSAVFSLFQDFAPIQMYRETKQPVYTIPIKSTATLSDNVLAILNWYNYMDNQLLTNLLQT